MTAADHLDCVVFDLDGTLVVEHEAVRQAIRIAARTLPATDEDTLEAAVLRIARRCWRAGPYHDDCLALGIASWEGLWATMAGCHPRLEDLAAWLPGFREQVWTEALGSAGCPDPPGHVAPAAEAFIEHQRHEHREVAGARQVVLSLRRRLPVGLLTNGPPDTQRAKVAQIGLDGAFDAMGISGVTGIGKPEAAAFTQVLTTLGADPSRSVMVGDDWERDVEGALGNGMRAVWLARGRRLPALRSDVALGADLGALQTLLAPTS